MFLAVMIFGGTQSQNNQAATISAVTNLLHLATNNIQSIHPSSRALGISGKILSAAMQKTFLCNAASLRGHGDSGDAAAAVFSGKSRGGGGGSSAKQVNLAIPQQ